MEGTNNSLFDADAHEHKLRAELQRRKEARAQKKKDLRTQQQQRLQQTGNAISGAASVALAQSTAASTSYIQSPAPEADTYMHSTQGAQIFRSSAERDSSAAPAAPDSTQVPEPTATAATRAEAPQAAGDAMQHWLEQNGATAKQIRQQMRAQQSLTAPVEPSEAHLSPAQQEWLQARGSSPQPNTTAQPNTPTDATDVGSSSSPLITAPRSPTQETEQDIKDWLREATETVLPVSPQYSSQSPTSATLVSPLQQHQQQQQPDSRFSAAPTAASGSDPSAAEFIRSQMSGVVSPSVQSSIRAGLEGMLLQDEPQMASSCGQLAEELILQQQPSEAARSSHAWSDGRASMPQQQASIPQQQASIPQQQQASIPQQPPATPPAAFRDSSVARTPPAALRDSSVARRVTSPQQSPPAVCMPPLPPPSPQVPPLPPPSPQVSEAEAGRVRAQLDGAVSQQTLNKLRAALGGQVMHAPNQLARREQQPVGHSAHRGAAASVARCAPDGQQQLGMVGQQQLGMGQQQLGMVGQLDLLNASLEDRNSHSGKSAAAGSSTAAAGADLLGLVMSLKRQLGAINPSSSITIINPAAAAHTAPAADPRELDAAAQEIAELRAQLADKDELLAATTAETARYKEKVFVLKEALQKAHSAAAYTEGDAPESQWRHQLAAAQQEASTLRDALSEAQADLQQVARQPPIQQQPQPPTQPQPWLNRAGGSVDELTWKIMATADKHSSNSILSVSEMTTFLRGTSYQPFSDYMTQGRNRNFKFADVNKDGALGYGELRIGVAKYLVDGQQQVQQVLPEVDGMDGAIWGADLRDVSPLPRSAPRRSQSNRWSPTSRWSQPSSPQQSPSAAPMLF